MNRLGLAFLFVLMLFLGAASVLHWPVKKQVITITPAMVANVTREHPPRCVVTNVIDGDTFACDLDGDGRVRGEFEKIRLLGIDTPEMRYSHKNRQGQDEPFAQAASQYAQQQLLKKVVYLEYDQQVFDRYGRTLAYVYLDARKQEMFNRKLLQQGLAKSYFIGFNRRHETAFKQDEALAKGRHRGMWKTSLAH